MQLLLSIFRILPLSITHRLGTILGYAIYALSFRTRKHIKSNLQQSNLTENTAHFEEVKHANIRAMGQSMLETLAIWQKNETDVLNMVQSVEGWEAVNTALAQKKGIIFLTPHLGCFEVTSIFYGAKHPITVLYRPPKLKFAHEWIKKGRGRTGVNLAEANASGVRKLMQALKKGQAVGILPDQVPKKGDGEWVDFFDKPAYTMTLASKLAKKSKAAIIMVFSERLANGKGFKIHLTPIESIDTPALLNAALEKQIAQKPEQYLWSYNRYKRREYALTKAGAPKD